MYMKCSFLAFCGRDASRRRSPVRMRRRSQRTFLLSLILHGGLVGALCFVPSILREEEPESSPPVQFEPEVALIEARSDRPRPDRAPRIPAMDLPPVSSPESAPAEPPAFPDPIIPWTGDLDRVPEDLPPSRHAGSDAEPDADSTAEPKVPPRATPTREDPAGEAGPSRRATASRRPPPEYPRAAVRRGLEGRVLLLVEVHPDGSVGKIEVTESSGHELLDRAAVEAVRKWSFEAALAQGQPVRSFIEVPFRFRIEE
jgi:protein TonB